MAKREKSPAAAPVAGEPVKAQEPEKLFLDPSQSQVLRLAMEMRQREMQDVDRNFATRVSPLREQLGYTKGDRLSFGEEEGKVFVQVFPSAPKALGDKVVELAAAKAASRRRPRKRDARRL